MVPFKTTKILILLVGLASVSLNLHLRDATQLQIDKLLEQQSGFQTSINNLLSNITAIQKEVSEATSTDQRIVILEQAIKSQRQSVYELSTTIIPPFNLSKSSCEQMTDEQKVNILQQLTHTKQQIQQLQQLSESLPDSEEVSQIKADIEKQIFFLNSIESIVHTKCESTVRLGPTIFQTNIYADGWILGNMTIDDLIEQYYQRSIRYDNITNCPNDHPFFNGQKCITCPETDPVFNIEEKKCVSCPADTHIDTEIKNCVPNKHVTDWSKVNNYYPKDGPFPKSEASSTSCPEETPFFNGRQCVSCELPKYWDIKSSSCLGCQTSQTFDVEVSQCVPVEKNKLTALVGNDWITDRPLSDVLSEQQAILDENQKTHSHEVCDSSKPFYDGIACISCPEGQYFNVDNKKCQGPPEGYSYNENMRKFLPVENKQTSTSAPNLIGSAQTDNPQVENCGEDMPFFDGQSCIACQEPFPYFDTATKTCVSCSGEKVYKEDTKECGERQTIYISTNTDGLMATPYVSIEEYEQSVKDKVSSNPDAIILNCENEADYSNYESCFPCAEGEYFNVQTLKCDTCDGNLDPETSKCKQTLYLFSNPDAPNIVSAPSKDKMQSFIDETSAEHPNSHVCDLDKPYSDGYECFGCEAPNYFFNYSSRKCVGCPEGTYYKDGECPEKVTVTNLDALTSYIGSPEELQAIKDKIAQVQKTGQTQSCPSDKPYFNESSSSCVACAEEQTYLNLETKSCEECQNYDDQNKECRELNKTSSVEQNQTENATEENNTEGNNTSVTENATENETAPAENATEENVTAGENATENATEANATEGNGTETNGTEGNGTQENATETNKTEANETAPTENVTNPQQNKYSNFVALNWIINDGTPDKVVDEIREQKEKQGAEECPLQTPYSPDGVECISCPQNNYFNYDTDACEECKEGTQFDINVHKCLERLAEGTFQQNPDVQNLIYGGIPYNQYVDTYNQNQQKYPDIQDCPVEQHFYDGITCIRCPTYEPYFDMNKQLCVSCPADSEYSADRKECISTAGATVKTDPNPAKMYANIF